VSGDSARVVALRGDTNRVGDWVLQAQPALVHDCWIDRRASVVCSHRGGTLAAAQARFDAVSRVVTAALGPRGWRLDREYPGGGGVYTRRYNHPASGARLSVRITQHPDGYGTYLFIYPPPATAAPPRP
jgi:hypothetical protein